MPRPALSSNKGALRRALHAFHMLCDWQEGASVRPEAVEALREVCAAVPVCIIAHVLSDVGEAVVKGSLEAQGLLGSGPSQLMPHRVLCCSTPQGKESIVRQLEPGLHIDADLSTVGRSCWRIGGAPVQVLVPASFSVHDCSLSTCEARGGGAWQRTRGLSGLGCRLCWHHAPHACMVAIYSCVLAHGEVADWCIVRTPLLMSSLMPLLMSRVLQVTHMQRFLPRLVHIGPMPDPSQRPPGNVSHVASLAELFGGV